MLYKLTDFEVTKSGKGLRCVLSTGRVLPERVFVKKPTGLWIGKTTASHIVCPVSWLVFVKVVR